MTEYAWPAALRPSRLSFYLQHNTLRFVSPVSRATQVLRRDGARWIAEASFDPLNRIQAGVLEGLLAALAGSANTVRIPTHELLGSKAASTSSLRESPDSTRPRTTPK